MSLFEKVREGRNQGWASKQSPSERKEEVGVVDRARVKPVGEERGELATATSTGRRCGEMAC